MFVSLKKFTESVSQELQNIVNQFHMNDSQVNKEYIAQCLFLTHTLTTTIIKYLCVGFRAT